MADMGSFGGMDEESAEIKRLDAEVVSRTVAVTWIFCVSHLTMR
jgi:hypothetical protein